MSGAAFDYRPTPRRTGPVALLVMGLIGAALAVAGGIPLLVPIVGDAGRVSAPGVIVDYRVVPGPFFGPAKQYAPRIRYAVESQTREFVATTSVNLSDTRALPPGATTTVRYRAGNPADVQWDPSGAIVATSPLAWLAFALGVLLVACALVLRAMNRIRRRPEMTP
jgi:hypothetical protein